MHTEIRAVSPTRRISDEFDRMRRPISGRDIVAALARSPLVGVNFGRTTVRSPVRDAHGLGCLTILMRHKYR
jgi:hypothetical protein